MIKIEDEYNKIIQQQNQSLQLQFQTTINKIN
jgi:hypothetical protein